MLYPAIDLSCFAIEAVVDIIMFTTILGIRFRDTRHPVIGLSMYFVCGNLIGYFSQMHLAGCAYVCFHI